MTFWNSVGGVVVYIAKGATLPVHKKTNYGIPTDLTFNIGSLATSVKWRSGKGEISSHNQPHTWSVASKKGLNANT